MNNRNTTNDPIQKAIDTMDRDTQFRLLLPTITNAILRIELMARWQEACETSDADLQIARKAAVLLSMHGVRS